MCVIIDNQNGATISRTHAERAIDHNPDGFGVVWLDAPFGRRVQKTLDADKAFCWITSARPCVIHCRYATHGSVKRENCHPFPLGPDRYLAHNGIVNAVTQIGDETDSEAVARMLSTLTTPQALRILTKLSGQRFALLDFRDGRTRVYRVGRWSFHRDHPNGPTVAYSNDGPLTEPRKVALDWTPSRKRAAGVSAKSLSVRARAWRDDWYQPPQSFDAIDDKCCLCGDWLLDSADDYCAGICGPCLAAERRI